MTSNVEEWPMLAGRLARHMQQSHRSLRSTLPSNAVFSTQLHWVFSPVGSGEDLDTSSADASRSATFRTGWGATPEGVGPTGPCQCCPRASVQHLFAQRARGGSQSGGRPMASGRRAARGAGFPRTRAGDSDGRHGAEGRAWSSVLPIVPGVATVPEGRLVSVEGRRCFGSWMKSADVLFGNLNAFRVPPKGSTGRDEVTDLLELHSRLEAPVGVVIGQGLRQEAPAMDQWPWGRASR